MIASSGHRHVEIRLARNLLGPLQSELGGEGPLLLQLKLPPLFLRLLLSLLQRLGARGC